MSEKPAAHISPKEADRAVAFDVTRAKRMAKYGLPKNFGMIGVVKPNKSECDRIAEVLEKATSEAEGEDRFFLPSYAHHLLSTYQMNGWGPPKALVRTIATLMDVAGKERSVRGFWFTEKKPHEKSLAIDLTREIIGDNPRHIPLRQLAEQICKLARASVEDGGLGIPDFLITDRTLVKMTDDLKKAGWLEPVPVEQPSAPALMPAIERKRPTLPTSLDPELSRLFPRPTAK